MDLRDRRRHERFPTKDGPRGTPYSFTVLARSIMACTYLAGVGWMSTYVGGQVDERGRFLFAETSGRFVRDFQSIPQVETDHL